MEKSLAAKKNTFHFEKAMAELENLVQKMEQGDITLEESLKQFEKGIALTRACQKALQEAEHKVNILIQENDKTIIEKFEPNE